MKDRYVEVFRRRRTGKTNYKKRRALIMSRLPFVKVFVSSKNVYAQLIRAEPSGDRTLASANSIQLSKFGWKGARKNLPACYLTGLLLAVRSRSSGVQDAVMYSGLAAYRRGSRLSALVKGTVDGGLKVRSDEETFPDEGRLAGGHISSYAGGLKQSDPSTYKVRFSKLLSQGLEPENLGQNFADTKAAILKGESR